MKLSVMWSERTVAPVPLGSAGFDSTFISGYNDSNQSRIVLSLAQGVRDLRDTGLTFSIA